MPFIKVSKLQKDVQKLQQEIANAKASYMEEHNEYINIATDFENLEQKYDFLQLEAEALKKIFPEPQDSSFSKVGLGFLLASAPFDVASGVAYVVSWQRTRKLMKIVRPLGVNKISDLRKLAKAGDSPELARIMFATQNSATAKLAKVDKALKIGRVTAAAGFALAIIGFALEIKSASEQKKYLEKQKKELNKHIDDFNGFIDEANQETQNLINAFLTYFNELEIDVEGIFNENNDGFLDENGAEKFDNPDNGAVAQLRSILNALLRQVGELNAAIRIANRRIERYISQGLAGAELIEEVVFDTELPEELVQRLYISQLRELGSSVQEATELSGLSEDTVTRFYARGFLEDGKTIEDTVELSGLAEEQVRRIFAAKLLDDELQAENPDDVIDVKAIAEQAGLPEEVVREIRAQQLAEVSGFAEESEL